MKKLFIHNALFRILSPMACGVTVYLLILLLNNSIDQLQENFISNELYVCIGLAYLIQEFSRASLLLFEKWEFRRFWLKILLQVLISLCISIILVSLTVYWYFKQILGFDPNISDMLMFNLAFLGIIFIYNLLYISHQFLYKVNSEKLEEERLKKNLIAKDYKSYLQGINPGLLNESLESIIVMLHSDVDEVDEAIDDLSFVYRYMLSKRDVELVPFKEEWKALHHLVSLFDRLPFRKIRCLLGSANDFLIIPGTLISLVETIIRSSIIIPDKVLDIEFRFEANYLVLSYTSNKKLLHPGEINQVELLNTNYSVYSEKAVHLKEKDKNKLIYIPLLNQKI